MKALWPLTLVLLLVVSAAAITWIVKPQASSAEAGPPPDLTTLESMQAGFNWMAGQVKPAVVYIEVEQKTKDGPGGGEESPGAEEMIPDPFKEFFRGPQPRQPQPEQRGPEMGQGSGVIIDPEGYILTNNHVAGKAEKITVHLASGETYPAKLTGSDALTDLAIIKIEPKKAIPVAKLGDAENLKVGSWAMAIGFPFGGQRYGGRFDEAMRYEPTVTVGVISATERQIESDIPGRPFRNLIQTDAPINPGNSGGPLVNIHGEVIGINQAIWSSPLAGGNIGVGFAVPIDGNTRSIIESLKGGEPVQRGQLGLLVAPLTPTLQDVYGSKDGVFVEEVQPDSPAMKGGVKSEDIILKFGGKDIASVDQFVSAVQNSKPGMKKEIVVLRDGEKKTLTVTVEALSIAARKPQQAKAEAGKLGVTIESLPAERAGELGLAGGVVVKAVNPRGQAARAGLQPGDVIVKINRRVIKDTEAFQQAEEELKKGDAVAIRVWRSDRMYTAQIEALGE
jgi:serine protease Do